jgi:hypothetical protein
MNTNIAYWRSIEREGLAELDAARKLSEVKLVAGRLMRARAELKVLTAGGLKWTAGRPAARVPLGPP